MILTLPVEMPKISNAACGNLEECSNTNSPAVGHEVYIIELTRSEISHAGYVPGPPLPAAPPGTLSSGPPEARPTPRRSAPCSACPPPTNFLPAPYFPHPPLHRHVHEALHRQAGLRRTQRCHLCLVPHRPPIPPREGEGTTIAKVSFNPLPLRRPRHGLLIRWRGVPRLAGHHLVALVQSQDDAVVGHIPAHTSKFATFNAFS